MKTVKQQNHKGYTLIELIVTILITGMIVLIIVAFISASRTSFDEIKTEATLQQEAQMAGSYIGDIAIEASECTTDSFTLSGNTYQVLCIKAPDPEYVSGTLYNYYFIILWEPDTQVLRFCKVKDDAVPQADGSYSVPADSKLIFLPHTARLDYSSMLSSTGLNIIGNNRALLARYITGMDVVLPNALSNSKLAKITLHLHYRDKDYIMTKNIEERNLN